MSSEYKNKTWEEMVVAVYDKTMENYERIEYLISELEDEILSPSKMDIGEIKEYVISIKNKVKICAWNKLADVSPNDMEMACEGYIIYQDGMHFEGAWRNNEFMIWLQDEKEWSLYKDSEDDPIYWLPLTYPAPY